VGWSGWFLLKTWFACRLRRKGRKGKGKAMKGEEEGHCGACQHLKVEQEVRTEQGSASSHLP
jgi:hypothetical protein